MGFIKYITVFDDESKMVLNGATLEKYKISAYPTVFFSDGNPYFSLVNAQSSDYVKLRNKSEKFVTPEIPEGVFVNAFQQAYDMGFLKVAVICPHSKWYPYYKSAMAAASRFRRHRNIDFSTFDIFVIDSKSFAVGPMLQALNLAHKHDLYGYSSSLAMDFANESPKNSKTFILTKSSTVFGSSEGDLTAYRVFANDLKNINLSNSHDYIKYDNFAKAVASILNKENARCAVSLGCHCDFAGNIIGRIKEHTDKEPFCCMQYGVASTAVLGDNTMCVHIF